MSDDRQTYIQWKGTDVCMDFYCPKCGEHSHFDGGFAYNIRCPSCMTYFEMGDQVTVKELPGKPDGCLLLSPDEDENTPHPDSVVT